MSKPSVAIVDIVVQNWRKESPYLTEEDIAQRLLWDIDPKFLVEAICQYLDQQYDAMAQVARVLENPFYSDSGKVKLIKRVVTAFGASDAPVSTKNYKKYLSSGDKNV